MTKQSGETPPYSAIFERQGIDPASATPDDYFLYEVGEDDHDRDGVNTHVGELYVLPRALSIKGIAGTFKMRENGAVIHALASVGPCVDLEERTIVHVEASLRGSTFVGRESIIGESVKLQDSYLEEAVIIGAESSVNDWSIGDGTTIGSNVSMRKVKDTHRHSGKTSRIEDGVIIGDQAFFEGENHIGSRSIVGEHTHVWRGATIGESVELGKDSTICRDATVNNDSFVMPAQSVPPGKTVRSNTLVRPEKFKRSIKGA